MPRAPAPEWEPDTVFYGLAEARTTYGVIGVKVWIFKGEIFDKPEATAAESPEAAAVVRP